MNRRTRPRRVLRHTVRLGTASEAPMPTAEVIDASPGGVLLAVSEPIGLLVGQRVCLSFALPDGALHLMADVTRVDRGDDFRTYVGVALEARTDDRGDPGTDQDPDVARWLAWLDAGEPTTSSEPSGSRGDPLAELAARLEERRRRAPGAGPWPSPSIDPVAELERAGAERSVR